ncbi:Multidrug and toxin extrusion (MATE) family efflux pump protein [Hyalangium minutum]|uniref:Multidrug and toxin extrusion (MATE) family efflux pump protein n=1 Tax=Hyalangium minutum TaxID=394096 RepID=A0A085WP85_9BACT|nr:Multidrug and toxin extrusion (MATE) family efflux pump protein [Hyalangium minutum]
MRDLCVLAMKTVATQVVPVLSSLYVASLVAKDSGLSFSSYSLVNSINLTAFLAVSGFLQALYFAAGQALGRRNPGAYGAAIASGAVLALSLGVVLTVLSLVIGPILGLLGLDSEVVALARPLGLAGALDVIPSFLLVVYRVHASLREKAGFVSLVYAAGAVGSAILSVFTLDLMKELVGSVAVGVLICVAATHWLMVLVAALSMRFMPELRFEPGVLAEAKAKLRSAMGLVSSVGWPIGVVMLLESLAPLVSSLVVGRYWVSVMPVHSIVLLWVSLCQVVPVGLGQAAVQRIAVLHSKGELVNRNRVAMTSLVLGTVFGAAIVAVFLSLPVELGAIFLGKAAFEPEAQEMLQHLMVQGGLLVAIQAFIIIGAAILRGVGQTRAPLAQCFVGYCVIASGSQILFGPVLGLGASGVWWGLVLGFGATALALMWRCYTELRSDLAAASPTGN